MEHAASDLRGADNDTALAVLADQVPGASRKRCEASTSTPLLPSSSKKTPKIRGQNGSFAIGAKLMAEKAFILFTTHQQQRHAFP
jgi:hypothetical protein